MDSSRIIRKKELFAKLKFADRTDYLYNLAYRIKETYMGRADIGRGDYAIHGSVPKTEYRDRAGDVIDRVYPKVVRILEQNAIDPLGFSDVYEEEDIQRDIKLAADKRRENLEKDRREGMEFARKKSKTLEAFIVTSDQHYWMGKHGKMVQASEVDDTLNGVDAIAEISGSETDTISHLALAIDSTSYGRMDAKFSEIRDDIRNGRLSHVDYFVSDSSPKQALDNLARLIAVADDPTLFELANLWFGKYQSPLAEHPYQLLLLDQFRMQLGYFRAYAQFMRKKNLVIAYDQAIEVIESILKEKAALREKLSSTEGYQKARYLLVQMEKDLEATFGKELTEPALAA